MRRIASFLVVVLALPLVLGGLRPAVAQDASPEAGAEQAGVGTEVSYVDAEGGEALVTVSEVVDPFADYDPNSPPEEGTRYALLTVAFENAGQRPFDADPFHLLLRDTDGFLWAPTSVPRPADIVVPDLQSQTMAPGNRISGVVGFQVPLDAELADVFYQPESGRLVLLAGLGAPTGPAPGSEVSYVDAEGAEALVTVTEVLDPFEEYDPSSPPEAGTRYVALMVAFENTGQQPFDADPFDLLVRDADGFLWGIASLPRPADVAVPDLQSQTMAPGNRVSGLVGFEVPAGAKLTEVYYQPESGRLITLVDPQAEADQAATPVARGAMSHRS